MGVLDLPFTCACAYGDSSSARFLPVLLDLPCAADASEFPGIADFCFWACVFGCFCSEDSAEVGLAVEGGFD